LRHGVSLQARSGPPVREGDLRFLVFEPVPRGLGSGATVFPREVPAVPASARSSSPSSHRRWGPWRILDLAALSLSSEGNHRERGDQDSDARKDGDEQDRIVQKPGWNRRRRRFGEGDQKGVEAARIRRSREGSTRLAGDVDSGHTHRDAVPFVEPGRAELADSQKRAVDVIPQKECIRDAGTRLTRKRAILLAGDVHPGWTDPHAGSGIAAGRTVLAGPHRV